MMMQNWTKNITTKIEDDKKLRNTIDGYVYVGKYHNLNIIYGI